MLRYIQSLFYAKEKRVFMSRRYCKTEEEAWEYQERMYRKKRRKRRRKIRTCCQFFINFGLLGLAVILLNLYLDKSSEFPGLESIIAEENDEYQAILNHSDEYPEELLTALEHNPEMLEFVSGYLNTEQHKRGELTKDEKEDRYPLFLQWDARWGYETYGNSCIGLSGCGPTCLTMVIHILNADSELTPADVAEYAEEQGYYVKDSGTDWSFMTDGAAAYGITGTELSLDQNVMERALDADRPIICALRAGDFTTSGHFIVIYDYDKDGFKVHDPNSRIRSERSWTYEELKWQIRNLWAFD